ncbi:PspC domain-containing protein [Oscillospiraceae bacterium]|uniref:PspC domain-containing protein n=1 Tax=Allofournierella sp. TaxID=1940256 RepID=UPI00208671E2|nr:PspC domain-containing protein [Oscillospiraceae bacterium]
MEPKRLTKGHTKMICGVCSGLAEYLNVDVTLVRLGTAVLTAVWGTGLVAYIVAAIIMPEPPLE